MVVSFEAACRESRELTGSTEEFAARVRSLVGQETTDISVHQARVLKLRLAMDFGARYGWNLGSAFAPQTLSRRGASDRKPDSQQRWPNEFTDHRYYFRSDRRAAALVGHPYDLADETKARAAEWAAQHQLKVWFPEDYPSWWYPGWTKMVVFEPID